MGLGQYYSTTTATKSCTTPAQTHFEFGIIAATSRNNIIGIDGTLPWRIPEDFRYFQDVTRDKVVILGRRTFGESLWMHARHSIVISSSMMMMNANDNAGIDKKRTSIARTLDDALDIAHSFVVDNYCGEGKEGSNAINTWVIGGEHAFLEALQHPAAKELRLTKVGLDVDTRGASNVRRFPPVSLWGNAFEQVEMWNGQEEDSLQQYSFHVYRRSNQK